MNDEIKLAGLEALVPEELEKHLILNSNRLRTFEDARLQIVTYEEAKFGSKIRDSKPSDTGSRERSDPMDVGAFNPLSRQFQVRWSTLSTKTAQQARTPASNRPLKRPATVSWWRGFVPVRIRT